MQNTIDYLILSKVTFTQRIDLCIALPEKIEFMRLLKYFLFFLAFALTFTVIKIEFFEIEVDSLFILETFVAGLIASIVIYVLNTYSKN